MAFKNTKGDAVHASLTIYHAANMTYDQRSKVSEWLKTEAYKLLHENSSDYPAAYTRRVVTPAAPTTENADVD